MTHSKLATKPVTRLRKRNYAHNPFVRTTPFINIQELDDSYQIEMTVPGIPKDRISLDIKDDQLIIEANQTEGNTETDVKLHRKEYDFATFKKVFTLNEEINQEAIDAKLEDGVLLITLDKKEEAKAIPPRSISIK